MSTRFSTTNDLDTVNAVKKLTTTSRINQSAIEGVLPIWGTNWNGVINFKGGVAAMVKLYEADPVKGYWKVAYADLEDGDKEGSLYSQYKNTYYRLGRPKLIELNSVTNGDAVQCEFLEHVLVADADNAINGDYTLVNVGTSKTAGAEKQHVQFTENGQTIDDYRDYSDGYISDIVNGKKTGYCNYAEQHYALQKLTGIEKQDNGLSIVWMLNSYAANYAGYVD